MHEEDEASRDKSSSSFKIFDLQFLHNTLGFSSSTSLAGLFEAIMGFGVLMLLVSEFVKSLWIAWFASSIAIAT